MSRSAELQIMATQLQVVAAEVHFITRTINEMNQMMHNMIQSLDHPRYVVDHNNWSPHAREEFREIFDRPLPIPREVQEIRREGWDS